MLMCDCLFNSFLLYVCLALPSLFRLPFGYFSVGQWRSSCRDGIGLTKKKLQQQHHQQQKHIGNLSERKKIRTNRADTSVGTPSYKTHMKLTIFSVSMADYGMYKCVAKNPRGETDGTIRLYGKFKTKIYYTYLCMMCEIRACILLLCLCMINL